MSVAVSPTAGFCCEVELMCTQYIVVVVLCKFSVPHAKPLRPSHGMALWCIWLWLIQHPAPPCTLDTYVPVLAQHAVFILTVLLSHVVLNAERPLGWRARSGSAEQHAGTAVGGRWLSRSADNHYSAQGST